MTTAEGLLEPDEFMRIQIIAVYRSLPPVGAQALTYTDIDVINFPLDNNFDDYLAVYPDTHIVAGKQCNLVELTTRVIPEVTE